MAEKGIKKKESSNGNCFICAAVIVIFIIGFIIILDYGYFGLYLGVIGIFGFFFWIGFLISEKLGKKIKQKYVNALSNITAVFFSVFFITGQILYFLGIASGILWFMFAIFGMFIWFGTFISSIIYYRGRLEKNYKKVNYFGLVVFLTINLQFFLPSSFLYLILNFISLILVGIWLAWLIFEIIRITPIWNDYSKNVKTDGLEKENTATVGYCPVCGEYIETGESCKNCGHFLKRGQN